MARYTMIGVRFGTTLGFQRPTKRPPCRPNLLRRADAWCARLCCRQSL